MMDILLENSFDLNYDFKPVKVIEIQIFAKKSLLKHNFHGKILSLNFS